MSDTNKYIGSKIAEFCEEDNLQKSVLCKHLNIDQSELEAYIDGELEIHCWYLYQIAELFDRDVAAFYPDESEEVEVSSESKRAAKTLTKGA